MILKGAPQLPGSIFDFVLAGLPPETLHPIAAHFTIPDFRFLMPPPLFVHAPLRKHIELSGFTASRMRVYVENVRTILLCPHPSSRLRLALDRASLLQLLPFSEQKRMQV